MGVEVSHFPGHSHCQMFVQNPDQIHTGVINLWIMDKSYGMRLVYMSIWATLKDMLNIGLGGPISGSFWASKYSIIQVFRHFLKYFPLVSHYASFTWLLGILLDVFLWCAPKALFLGTRVKKVAAELVRLSDLVCFVCYLFCFCRKCFTVVISHWQRDLILWKCNIKDDMPYAYVQWEEPAKKEGNQVPGFMCRYA